MRASRIQGEIENKIDVGNLEQPLEFPLSEYEAGKIKLVLEINGAKDVSSHITIK